MISGISQTSQIQNFSLMQNSGTQSLSTDQTKALGEALSELDANSLTESDALSVVEALQEAGIAPGVALEEAMSALGFDAKEIGDLAGVGQSSKQGAMPPPPPSSDSGISALNISEDQLSELNDLLSSFYSEDSSEDDKETLLSSIQKILEAGAPEGGLVDLIA